MGYIRHGTVSQADYDTGRIKVTYKEKNDCVSTWLEYFNFNGEYKVPEIGSKVIILMFDSTKGVAIGGYFNKETILKESGKGVFIKELGMHQGEATVIYKDGTIRLKAENIEFELGGKVINLKELVEKVNNL